MLYNPDFLQYKQILQPAQIKELNALNSQFSLEQFLSNHRAIEEIEIDFIYTSAIIEGNTYSQADTEALLKYGQTAGGKRFNDALMLLNLRDAWQLIFSDLNTSIDFGYLKDIHFEIMKGGLLERHLVGVLRDEYVSISGCSYKPLAVRGQIDTEIRHLFATAATIENPYDKALYLHNNIAYLQPFKDGNKRTARMISMASLAHDKVVPLLWYANTVSEYLASIVSYYETGKYEAFIRYFLSAYKKMYSIKFNVDCPEP